MVHEEFWAWVRQWIAIRFCICSYVLASISSIHGDICIQEVRLVCPLRFFLVG